MLFFQFLFTFFKNCIYLKSRSLNLLKSESKLHLDRTSECRPKRRPFLLTFLVIFLGAPNKFPDGN
jgi:hypothetical protein